jgi:hypothetical protein
MTMRLLCRYPRAGRRVAKAFACLWLALPSIAAAATAPGAVLEAEVEGNTVVIYSSMKKAGGCKAAVLFSYRKGDQRQTRRLECNFRVPAQERHRFCEQSNPEFIDLRIESATIGGCE